MCIRDRLKALEEDAAFGRQCREDLIKEVVSLGLLLDFGADETVLTKSFSALSCRELSDLKTEMSKKAAALFPPKTQLPAAKGVPSAMDNAFMI